MGVISDVFFGPMVLGAYLMTGMYEKGISLADLIIEKCERLQIDVHGGIAGIFRLKVELLVALILQRPEENRQHRIKEAENALGRAFDYLEKVGNRYQEVIVNFRLIYRFCAH